MSRKKICIFMGEIVHDFQREASEAIAAICRERGYEAVLFASYGSYIGPNGKNVFFELGQRNIIHLPDLMKFDAIIAVPDSFDVYGMADDLFDMLRGRTDCPVVTLRNGAPDFPNVTVDNFGATKALANHFIYDHKFTRFCYMSGPLGQNDASTRYEGFLAAIREAGITFGEEDYFEGDYWKYKGDQAIDHFLNRPREKWPQAILCANDYMALSVLSALQKRNIRVPEDICVAGFDDNTVGRMTNPSLTTIRMAPKSFVEAAFEIIEDSWAGRSVSKTNYVKYELILRESCGCCLNKEIISQYELVNELQESDSMLREISRLCSDYQTSFAIENAFSVADYHFQMINCSTGYLCLCDNAEESYSSLEGNSIYSENMILKMIMHKDRNIPTEYPDIKFRRTEILPHSMFAANSTGSSTGNSKEEPSFKIVFQVHFRTKAYGYLVVVPSEGEWPNLFTIMYLNNLAYALETSYIEAKYTDYAELKKQSLLDPLTGVYNRRGFEQSVQNLISGKIKNTTCRVTFVSLDADNLKPVNDKYGHAEGDFVIRSIAEIITSCMEKGDICVRTGGDEFTIILVSDDGSSRSTFVDKVNERVNICSDSSGKPYKLHVSMGICGPLAVKDVNLSLCMQQADKNMYEKKRLYKGLESEV